MWHTGASHDHLCPVVDGLTCPHPTGRGELTVRQCAGQWVGLGGAPGAVRRHHKDTAHQPSARAPDSLGERKVQGSWL